MKKHIFSRRILAMTLSLAMVLGNVPVVAAAASPGDMNEEITAFEELPSGTANQEPGAGTSLMDMALPEALNTDLTDSWEYISSVGGNSSIYSLFYVNERFYVAGDNGLLKSSEDCSNWTSLDAGVNDTICGIAYGNSVYALVGGPYSYNSGFIRTSSNGTDWSSSLTISAMVTSVAFGKGIFVAGDMNGKVYWSDNASSGSWTTVNVTGGAGIAINSIVYANGKFIAVGGHSSNYNNGFVAISEDGKNWSSPVYLPGAYSLINISGGQAADGSSMFMGIDVASNVYISSDGTYWSSTNLGVNYLYAGICRDGQFTVVESSGIVEVSTNGSTWSQSTIGGAGELYSVVYGDGAFVVIDETGNIYMKTASVSLSSEKLITSVTAPASAVLDNTAYTVTAAVTNDVTSQQINVTVSDNADWALYSDTACTQEISNKAMSLDEGANTAYIKVTAEDNSTQIYTVTITREDDSSPQSMNVTSTILTNMTLGTSNLANIKVTMPDIGLVTDDFTIMDTDSSDEATVEDVSYSNGAYTLTVSGMSLYDDYTVTIEKTGYSTYTNDDFYGTLVADGDIDIDDTHEKNIFETFDRTLTSPGVLTISNSTFAAGATLYSGNVYEAIDSNNGYDTNGTLARVIGIFAVAPNNAKGVKTLRPDGQMQQVGEDYLIDGNPNYEETVASAKAYNEAHASEPGFQPNTYADTVYAVALYSTIASVRQSDGSRVLQDPEDRFRIIAWYDNDACTGTPIKVVRLMVEVNYTGMQTSASVYEKLITSVTAPAGAVLDNTAYTVTAAVTNDVTSQQINVTVSDNADWALYSDTACTQEISNKTMSLDEGANTAYIKVTAEDNSTQIYTVTITREDDSSGSVGETFTPSGTRQDISPTVAFDKYGYATVTNVPDIPSGYTLMYAVDFGDCGSYTSMAEVNNNIAWIEPTTPLSDEFAWYLDDGNYTARGTYFEGAQIDIRSGSKSLLLTVVKYEQYGNTPGNQYWIYGAYLCAIPQKITYNLNGGNVSGDASAKTEYLFNDDALATTFAEPVKEGASFSGWYTAATGGSKVTSAADSAATYYAQWENETQNGGDIHQRTTGLDLTISSITYQDNSGDFATANPQTSDITDTGEGWAWYLNANAALGYQAKTLVLNGIDLNTADYYGIYLPGGSTIILADGSENYINVTYQGSMTVRGIIAVGDLTVSGNTGSLQVTSGPSSGDFNTGIYSNRNMVLSGGEITVNAGNARSYSYGIVAVQTITILKETVYATSGSVSGSRGLSYPIVGFGGIIDNGMAAYQKVSGEYTQITVKSADGHYYVYGADTPATDLKVQRKASVSNTAGTAAVAYSQTAMDLTAVSGLFLIDGNAGAQTYTVEAGGTGAGTITGNLLTITGAGTINIGLTTAETVTHGAGAKVVATLTVSKGVQTAPIGLGKTDATTHSGSDGKITGLLENTVYEYKKDEGSYITTTTNSLGEITGLGAGAYVVRLPENAVYSAGPASAQIIIGQPDADSTPPTGTITVKGNTWTALQSSITFGLFFKNTADITITANDDSGDTVAVAHYISDAELSQEEVIALAEDEWTEGSSFSINTNSKAVIYVRLTDTAGNITYISSNGMVVYFDSVAGDTSISFTKGSSTDIGASVQLNGNTVAKIMNGTAVLSAGTDYTVADGTITFKAVYLESLAANSYTLAIYYDPMGEAYITAEGNDSPAVTNISLTVSPASTYEITLAPSGDKTFAAQTVGYSPVSGHSVTINNIGNQATGVLTVALSGTDGDSFTLSQTSISSITPGGSASFTVSPKDNLSVKAYTATVTVSGNNGISETFDVNFTVQKGAQSAPTGLGRADVTVYGGSDGKITGLKANTVYEYKKDEGSYIIITANNSGEITDLGAGTYVVRLPENALYSASPASVEVIISQPDADSTPPTGTIAVKSNTWTALQSSITFGLFFKNTADITITAEDDSEAAVETAYYISDEELGGEEVRALAEDDWTEGSSFSINTNRKAVIYARLTDATGNKTYISSNGIVVYNDSAAEDSSISFAKGSNEDVAVGVQLNGNTVDRIMNGAVVLSAGTDYTVADGTITFKAAYLESLGADSYTLTVYYNPMGEAYATGEGNDSPAVTNISLTVNPVLVEEITISGGNAINAKGGSLQLTAVISPTNATNKAVLWTIQSGSIYADISSDGILTAKANGTVTVRAAARDSSNVFGEVTVSISGQTVISDNNGGDNGNTGNNDSEAGSGTEKITVDVKEGNTDSTVSIITIERTTGTDGKKKDTVTYDKEKAEETVQKLKKEGKDTARIVIPESKEEVSETIVNIPSESVRSLSTGEINLRIDTGAAKIDITEDTLRNISQTSEEDLYFRLIPVKDTEQKEAVTNRALVAVSIINADGKLELVGSPVTIETNMPSTPADITLPLTGIEIPAGAAEREALLKQMAVYIEHSDGEKELIQGELVEYGEGVYGIRIHINKFSVFTLVKTDAFLKSSESNIISVTSPAGAVIKGTKITATVANKTGNVTVKVKVSEKASWKLYSDKACTKELSGGKLKLKTGSNTAYIRVTAEDGTGQTYQLAITREKSSQALITKINVPENAKLEGSTITATVANEISRLTIKAEVSSKASWKLYSDKKCTKEIAGNKLSLKEGVNTAYLKVTAENGKTSRIYTLKITRREAPKAQYETHVKLGLIGSKAYAQKIAAMFEKDYAAANVTIKQEGKYYRVTMDFTDKAAANKACKDMIERKYIINYYFYQ